jgi:hypothetical protein
MDEKYEGNIDEDPIKNGGSYIKQNKFGHEIYNYLNCNNKYYGYTQIPGKQLKLNRIDKENNRDYIDGVRIIFVAKKPKEGGEYIVSWYNNAKAYQNKQKCPVDRINKIDQDLNNTKTKIEAVGNDFDYWFETNTENGVILPEDKRNFKLSKYEEGGLGKSNILYADKEKDENIKMKINNYINNYINN